MPPTWTTACPDWERRIVAGESLVPCPPLFPDEAEAALKVFKALPIVDMPGVPDGFGGFRPPTFGEVCRPWVFDFVSAIFGAYDPESGQRLINEFFELIAKKNIKSTMAAGIMITALVRNWRLNQELTILAPTIEVAKNSADPAMAMVLRNSELLSLLRPVQHRRLIEHRTTKAELKILAADTETVSGSKAGFVLIEEFWLFGKMASAETMLREATGGLTARPEGFVIKLSTMSDQPPAGVFKADLNRFRDIRDGKLIAPRSMGILYEFPKAMLDAKAYEHPSNFYVTNPNYGASVGEAYLQTELDKARANGPQSVADFFAKHLNIEIGQNLRSDRWPGSEHWAARADKALTLEEVIRRCEVIAVGVDGGGLDDLYGLSVLGRCKESGRWLLWSHAWCYRGVLTRRKIIATLLLDYEKLGELTIVDDSVDIDTLAVAVIAKVVPLLAAVMIDSLGPHHGLVAKLNEIGLTSEGDEKTILPAPQGIPMMSAIKTSELKLARGELWHSGSSCMAWAVGNLKIEPTATAIRATKQHAGDAKVDPAMAFFNAVSLMQTNPEPPSSAAKSYLETHDLLVL